MMKALIFGANGQDGFYLKQLFESIGVEVIATSRNGLVPHLDVGDFRLVEAIISLHKPDYIFHLAANSTTRHNVLFENHSTISTGTLNILESVKIHSPASKVFISGSGLQFRNEGHPIRETDPFEAKDAYSVSRIHSVYAARYYRGLGIKTYVGYFFNHDSPLRSQRHINKMIADAVLRIAAGKEEFIEIGDIEVKKEWGFAGDIVKAVWTLVQQDTVFESVLGTGKAYSIKDYIELCFKSIDKDWREYVRPKQGFQSAYNQLVSDPSTIFSLGWRPEVSFEALTYMMLKNG